MAHSDLMKVGLLEKDIVDAQDKMVSVVAKAVIRSVHEGRPTDILQLSGLMGVGNTSAAALLRAIGKELEL